MNKIQLVEPCCAPKHITNLRNSLGEYGTAWWHGFGDLSMAELLPAILKHYTEADVIIAVPALPDDIAVVIEKMMKRQWPRMDGKGMLDVVRRMTVVTDFRKKKSPAASSWMNENPFGDRLVLVNRQQNDTAVILPDMAFLGNINLSYGNHFTAVATKNADIIAELRNTYSHTPQKSV